MGDLWSASWWGVALATPNPPSPTASETPANPDDLYVDQLFERYGVNPNDIPVWGLQGWYLFSFVVAVAVTVLLLRAIYRGMQRPRLQLEFHADRPPSATRRDVLRYLATPFIWIPLWFTVVLSVLLLAANRGETIRPANELVIAAAVVVGGSRLLAYINLEGAHELAKSVPLTLLSLILISGQTISLEAAFVALFVLAVNIDSLSYYIFLLALWDVLFTFGWWILVRARWRRSRRVNQHKRPSWLEAILETLGEAWGNKESGPAESPLGPRDSAATTADVSSDAGVRQMMLMPDAASESASNTTSEPAPTRSTGSDSEDP